MNKNLRNLRKKQKRRLDREMKKAIKAVGKEHFGMLIFRKLAELDTETYNKWLSGEIDNPRGYYNERKLDIYREMGMRV